MMFFSLQLLEKIAFLVPVKLFPPEVLLACAWSAESFHLSFAGYILMCIVGQFCLPPADDVPPAPVMHEPDIELSQSVPVPLPAI